MRTRARDRRRYSGATVSAVTWPWKSWGEPSALPRTGFLFLFLFLKWKKNVSGWMEMRWHTIRKEGNRKRREEEGEETARRHIHTVSH